MLTAVQPPPVASDWLLRPRREQLADTSLILFPYAGLGASLAAILSRFVNVPVSIHGVQLPGRENRVSEPPLSEMPSIVEALLPVIAPLAERPYVLMGCSFGALIAYELALRLQALGMPPRHFIALACAAPTLGRFRTNLSHLDDAALLDALDARFGGVPAAVKQNLELQRLFLPALRADIRALDTYEWRRRPVLDAPLLTIGGTQDREVSAGDLALWGELCSGPATQNMVEGGHFVLRENPAAIAAVLNARLGAALV
jgi:medium-chain acyl-[acyl-carrier-protein] hydrolase